jgi:hypothetical protein
MFSFDPAPMPLSTMISAYAKEIALAAGLKTSRSAILQRMTFVPTEDPLV